MGSGCAWVTQMTDDLDRLVLDFLRQLNHNVLEHFEFNEKLPSKNNLTKTMSCQLYYVCGFFFFFGYSKFGSHVACAKHTIEHYCRVQ